MQGEGARRALAGGLEQSLLQHVPGAVEALFAGLEHEDDPPGDLRTTVGEQAGGAGEHRDVRVVTARVHDAVDLRGEVQAGVLGQRQGIHVAAQQHRGPVGGAVEHRHDRGRRTAGAYVEAEVADLGADRLLRDRQLQTYLGPAVQPAPEVDRAVGELVGLR